jgi:hypothetical protein
MVADADRDQAPDRVGRRRRPNTVRHIGQNSIADGPAVEKPVVVHAIASRHRIRH